jgi:hypothetical protein
MIILLGIIAINCGTLFGQPLAEHCTIVGESTQISLDCGGHIVRQIARAEAAVDSELGTILKIDVFDPKTGKHQVLSAQIDFEFHPTSDPIVCNHDHSYPNSDSDSLADLDECEIQFVDVNFDSILDMCIVKGEDPRYGPYYQYWTFSQTDSLFHHALDFDYVSAINPMFNYSQQEISVADKGAGWYENQKYKILSGVLTEIENIMTEGQFINQKQYDHVVVKRLVNGELKVVQDTITPSE